MNKGPEGGTRALASRDRGLNTNAGLSTVTHAMPAEMNPATKDRGPPSPSLLSGDFLDSRLGVSAQGAYHS